MVQAEILKTDSCQKNVTITRLPGNLQTIYRNGITFFKIYAYFLLTVDK